MRFSVNTYIVPNFYIDLEMFENNINFVAVNFSKISLIWKRLKGK